MTGAIVVDGGAQAFAPQGELTIYTVTEIRDRLLEAMAMTDKIEIDLTGVTDIDTAGLQLMLLAKRKPGKEVRFTHHSAAVLRLVDMANVGLMLGDPLVISGGGTTPTGGN
ncbi:MAG: hypothetical protein A2045_10700 [Rhodocyclales bacterium GWA2_65_20]|nr:MAG: hypothetical protein A2045_10700 [Rhodocyclales bacterium GWA2_65_20]